MAIYNVARVAAMNGQWAEAYAGFEKVVNLFQQLQYRPFYNASRSEIAHVLRKQGWFDEAAVIYRETIHVFTESGQLGVVAHEFECLGFIAVASGQAGHAARLLGAAEAMAVWVVGTASQASAGRTRARSMSTRRHGPHLMPWSGIVPTFSGSTGLHRRTRDHGMAEEIEDGPTANNAAPVRRTKS